MEDVRYLLDYRLDEGDNVIFEAKRYMINNFSPGNGLWMLRRFEELYVVEVCDATDLTIAVMSQVNPKGENFLEKHREYLKMSRWKM